MTKAQTKTVGVIGGLGPAATADFFAKLIRATNAGRDQDHLRVLIDNNPHIPDRNAAIAGEGPSPGPALAETARGLERAGAQCILVVCNAAHHYRAEIEAAIAVPFLSMIDATVAAVSALAPRPRRVGVLGADGGLKAGLYQHALMNEGMEALILDDDRQRAFMALIYRIKAGELDVADEMRAFADRLIETGAEAIIAGCTEIPLVLAPDSLSRPLISPTDALIARALAFARAH